jgi:hypothetical protein
MQNTHVCLRSQEVLNQVSQIQLVVHYPSNGKKLVIFFDFKSVKLISFLEKFSKIELLLFPGPKQLAPTFVSLF